MRGATYRIRNYGVYRSISTHAPHARCNMERFGLLSRTRYFYSRTSCEVQLDIIGDVNSRAEFLLTHLMRGATGKNDRFLRITKTFLLTHLMRGATSLLWQSWQSNSFLLTHLMRGATHNQLGLWGNIEISTHAPHARCNPSDSLGLALNLYFYSRTSCEVQPKSGSSSSLMIGFLLTHLMRGATGHSRFCRRQENRFLLTHLMRGATSFPMLTGSSL